MAPDHWNNPRELPYKPGYATRPVLRDDEELIEYREPTGSSKGIHIYEGEIVLGTDGSRFSYGGEFAREGWFKSGVRGRYIIKNKGTVTQSPQRNPDRKKGELTWQP